MLKGKAPLKCKSSIYRDKAKYGEWKEPHVCEHDGILNSVLQKLVRHTPLKHSLESRAGQEIPGWLSAPAPIRFIQSAVRGELAFWFLPHGDELLNRQDTVMSLD